MRFSSRTLLIAAATALVAAACSSASVVATVDGAPIDNASVVELRTSFTEGSDYDAESYRGDLTNLIYLEAQKSAAEQDFGLTGFDDPELIAAKIANPTEDEAQIFANVGSDPDRSDATKAAVAEQLLIRDAVVAELTDDEVYLAGVYENQPALLVSVCARHILVATSEEADAVKARLDAGEGFAEVANEVSLDTNAVGGELPCPTAAADYVEEFSTAAALLPVVRSPHRYRRSSVGTSLWSTIERVRTPSRRLSLIRRPTCTPRRSANCGSRGSIMPSSLPRSRWHPRLGRGHTPPTASCRLRRADERHHGCRARSCRARPSQTARTWCAGRPVGDCRRSDNRASGGI